MDNDNTIGQPLTLLCLAVDGDKNFFGTVFAVEITSNALVARLKDDIKAEKARVLDYFAADQLTLWKLLISIPTGRTRTEITNFNQKVKEIKFPDPESDEAFEENGDIQLLVPSETLSDYGLHLSEPKRLHVIVQVPQQPVDTHTSRGTKRKRNGLEQARDLLDAFAKEAPSSLGKPPQFKLKAAGLVQCNRPFEYDTLPVALLQEEFGYFKDDCTKEPSATAMQLLEDLTVAACEWYDHEDARRDAIKEVVFKKANVSLSPGVIRGTTRITDGNSQLVIFPSLIRKCKNNEGCALFEDIGYYSNFLREQLYRERYTRFPSILMTDVGPQIGFYACIWTGENIVVEPLTPVYDLTVHWTDDEARQQIAATLDAVVKTITRLDQHYQGVESNPSEIQREYPFWTSFVDWEGLRTKFRYTSRISSKLVFTAVSEAKEPLIIKFTRQYSETAHRCLAKIGCAPTFRAITHLQAGWKMIVMEQSQYTQLNSSTLGLDDESRLTIKHKVREIIEKLHAEELVHGDIRQVNILINKSTLGSPEGVSIHLIDFDWAGKAGTVKYPLRINTNSVRRPSDVGGGKLITKSHDLGMIDLLFYSV